ncbi:unnamed protein product [Periconia digitata]|uniref:Uncharacterized protein n=1 Tax=Periconia digitata TaxID=1303443 RepID=A0A9W4XM94_9PLEO|nr:unnamed protein product [Periconia digitata]
MSPYKLGPRCLRIFCIRVRQIQFQSFDRLYPVNHSICISMLQGSILIQFNPGKRHELAKSKGKSDFCEPVLHRWWDSKLYDFYRSRWIVEVF